MDNDSSKRFTILTVEVKVSAPSAVPPSCVLVCCFLNSSLLRLQDYPGLLRVIAWVVNGLDLLVENARCVLGPCAALASASQLFCHRASCVVGALCIQSFHRQSWPAGW